MRLPALVLVALLALFTVDAQACSPTVDYATRTMQQKIESASLVFIGKVEEVGEGYVIFRVGTAGKGAAAKGETMKLDHKEYGTCGKLDFKVGDVWLYAGDSTFSGSQKIEEADMEADIAVILARLDAPPQTP